MKTKIALISIFTLFFFENWAQNALIKGFVLDENNEPIENVSVFYRSKGVVTNNDGFYEITVPSNVSIKLNFSHVAFEKLQFEFRLRSGEVIDFSPVLKSKPEEMKEVLIKDQSNEVQGNVTVKTQTIKNIPGANQGVESILKTLPGVNFNNELSTQYNVRGGSFDENLIYINGIEVYKPFLVRSGQQEGLSIVNPQMTQNVKFSAGGFQAKYGDKLSSVLDITYRKPEAFGLQFDASLLGFGATVEGLALNNKMQIMVGARYRNNSLFVDQNDTRSNFNPSFTDIQSFLTYRFSDKFSMEFLGTAGLNDYNFTPFTRKTNFGTVLNPVSVIVDYEGKEEDHYQTISGALKGTYAFNQTLSLELTGSTYYTREQEYYDIIAAYGIGNVNTDLGSDDFGNADFIQSIGIQQDHARNELEAKISNFQAKLNYKKSNRLLEFGLKYQNEDFKDRVIEWQMIDSAGFAVRPPNRYPGNNEPYIPYTTPIIPFQNVRAFNNVNTKRILGFTQISDQFFIQDQRFWYNIGVRAQHWVVSGKELPEVSQTVFSPRAQLAWKPSWKRDMLFRISGGLYQQPPFYREMRDSLGMVHPEVKAQKSVQIVLGNDYSFDMWNRPFKLSTEAFYKKLTDVNPFTIDNVRIRYRAKNNANAYAAGFEIRLNGEFVEGTESWFSFGYLRTEENIENRGYISRPTDQRLKFALLFQDYIPAIPNIKMYLNTVYNTGVPGGSPSYADPYDYQNRLKDYFRADLGVSYVFKDINTPSKEPWLKSFKSLSAGIEVFNMFDAQNTISNTWVTDVSSNQSFAVPNYLSPRILNVKVSMSL
ncbi:MAG: carboxypeptidase-like regulatory domain-containing protein [Lutimonas sp.]